LFEIVMTLLFVSKCYVLNSQSLFPITLVELFCSNKFFFCLFPILVCIIALLYLNLDIYLLLFIKEEEENEWIFEIEIKIKIA